MEERTDGRMDGRTDEEGGGNPTNPSIALGEPMDT